ncbi:MAG TPA: hypothetical protein VJR89_15565, partial [Polyangiales bacterium]|nr:hypothetical protein [Polyangiales bacterium]
MNPPNDKKTPPEGLLWGAGEPRAPKRQPASSPDVKGLFTESVIEQLPEADAEIASEEDAVGKLFSKQGAAVSEPARSLPKAHWHEPGTPQRGPESRVKLNLPAAMQAAAPSGKQPLGRMLPAGAMGAGAAPARQAAGPAKPAQGTFGAA